MSSALDRFRKPGGVAPTPGRPPPKKKNRWAGINSDVSERDPFPWLGLYMFRVLETTILTEQGETYRATLEVVEANVPPDSRGTPGTQPTKVGDRVVFLQKLDGQSFRAGGPQVKRFTKAVVGIATDEEFDQVDPDGLLIDAGSGNLNDQYPENPLLGRLVVGEVLFQKEIEGSGGDFYRRYNWMIVPEADQK